MTPTNNLPEPANTASPPATQDPTNRLIEIYLRTLTSPQTKKTYNTEIRMFVSYLDKELGKGIEGVTVEDLSLYREHLIEGYASATAAKKLTTMRRFLTFTYMGGATTVNPEALKFFAKSPKVRQDPSYNILTEEELSRMLSAARQNNYRDYVLLAVMSGCGLREAEVIDVRVGDFQEVGEDQILLRVIGKGDKIRNVPTSPDLWQLVQRYVILTKRSFTSRTDARKPLFASREGKDKPLTTRMVRYLVKKYANAAGITKAISPTLHPPHRRHQHGRKRSSSTYNTTVPRTRRSKDNNEIYKKGRGTGK